MPTYRAYESPGITVEITYATNGKVSGASILNQSPDPFWCRVTLTGGHVYEGTYQPSATPYTMNFPPNLVSVTFDAQGEPTWVGLLRVETGTQRPT